MKNMRCSECGSKNEYEWKEVLRRYESDEYQVEINVKVPVCIKCGAPIFDETIENDTINTFCHIDILTHFVYLY